MGRFYTLNILIFLFITAHICVGTSLFAQAADQSSDEGMSLLKKNMPSPDPDLFITDKKLLDQTIYNKKIVYVIENNQKGSEAKINIDDIVSEAKSSGFLITKLNLSNKNLTQFPNEILALTDLEYLDLSNNNLTDIPSGISKLKKLKYLSLNNNSIDSIPVSLFTINSLELLKLEYNSDTLFMPSNVNMLSNLKTFWVSGVKELPSTFWELSQLQNIRLWNSGLTSLPPEIRKFKQLNEICLRGNLLTEIPQEIFSIKKLTYLSAAENRLTKISPKINKLRKLDYLGIYDNPIKEIQLKRRILKSLRFLSAWDTQISEHVLQQIQSKSKNKDLIQLKECSH
jgi:Leucine-rich repeat (LRR) protein